MSARTIALVALGFRDEGFVAPGRRLSWVLLLASLLVLTGLVVEVVGGELTGGGVFRVAWMLLLGVLAFGWFVRAVRHLR